jgi:hypothetical protein
MLEYVEGLTASACVHPQATGAQLVRRMPTHTTHATAVPHPRGVAVH